MSIRHNLENITTAVFYACSLKNQETALGIEQKQPPTPQLPIKVLAFFYPDSQLQNLLILSSSSPD